MFFSFAVLSLVCAGFAGFNVNPSELDFCLVGEDVVAIFFQSYSALCCEFENEGVCEVV